MREGVLERYRDFLEITPNTPMISMGEGSTPLVKSRFIGSRLGCDELYFKLEGCNPSGSFKDRGMVMAVAKAMEMGSAAIMCASTGNTSASAAAYGAYCGLATIVLVPGRDVAFGKMAQAMAFGPRILVINGTFDQALEMVRDFTRRYPVTLVNSLNPHRLEGQKTRGLRDRRRLGRRAGLSLHTGWKRRKYNRLLERVLRVQQHRQGSAETSHDGFPGRGGGPHSVGNADCRAPDGGLCHTDRQPGQLGRSPEGS